MGHNVSGLKFQTNKKISYPVNRIRKLDTTSEENPHKESFHP